MRYLITGSAGFVGSRVCERLRGSGVDVRRMIRSEHQRAERSDIVADLTEGVDLTPALAGTDCVVHLAARVHVMRDTSAAPLDEFRRVNVTATRRLAEAAAARGVTRFVFVSTVKVHGEATFGTPFRADGPIRPADPYARSKAEAEDVLGDIGSRTGLEIVIVRPPLVYGPGVRANFLKLLVAVRRGAPLPFGLVDNRRSLLFVDNLAELLVRASTERAAAGDAFLAADGPPVSTADLVKALARSFDRSCRLLPVPPSGLRWAGKILGKGAAVERLLGSLEVDDAPTRLRLGWIPPVSFDEALADTADWFTDEMKAS